MRRVNPAVLAGAAGALILVVLVWYFTLWAPRNKTYNEVSADAQSAAAQVQQLQAQVSRLKSVNLPQLNRQLSTLQAAVPDQPQLDQIILSVNGAAQQSGVVLGTISPTPPAASAGSAGSAGAPPHISLSITCAGGYFQVLDFVNRLDTLPRLIVVDSLSLNPGSGNGAGGNSGGAELSVTLTARMFVSQLSSSAAASSGAPTSPATGGSTTTTTSVRGSTPPNGKP